MRLQSVNVGVEETIVHNGRDFSTGIAKRPATGLVIVEEGGVRGDAVVDIEHHGGADQAVYAYSADDYDWWSEHRGGEYSAGLFGENLTISGMPSDMNVGDRLLIGDVVLEATSPRIPCSTFAARMQDTGFGLEFRAAERPGVYFRVLNGGTVAAGDAVTFVASDDANGVSIVELFRFNYAFSPGQNDVRRFLEAPIASRFRAKIEKRALAT